MYFGTNVPKKSPTRLFFSYTDKESKEMTVKDSHSTSSSGTFKPR